MALSNRPVLEACVLQKVIISCRASLAGMPRPDTHNIFCNKSALDSMQIGQH